MREITINLNVNDLFKVRNVNDLERILTESENSMQEQLRDCVNVPSEPNVPNELNVLNETNVPNELNALDEPETAENANQYKRHRYELSSKSNCAKRSRI